MLTQNTSFSMNDSYMCVNWMGFKVSANNNLIMYAAICIVK